MVAIGGLVGLADHLPRRLRGNPTFRRAALSTYVLAARLAGPRDGIRLLLNSIPKSGTHLATRVVDRLPGFRYSGLHVTGSMFQAEPLGRALGPEDWEEITDALERVRGQQYVTAHLLASAELSRILLHLDVRSLLLIRNPRDVAVSTVHYICGKRDNWLHDRLVGDFDTFEDRLRAVICGLPRAPGKFALEPMAERLNGYLPWLRDSSTLLIRFEDLVGEQGGGDQDRSVRSVQKIAQHLRVSLGTDQARRIASEIFSERSATFRAGRIGAWREAASEETWQLFERLAGAECHELGYPPAL